MQMKQIKPGDRVRIKRGQNINRRGTVRYVKTPNEQGANTAFVDYKIGNQVFGAEMHQRDLEVIDQPKGGGAK